MTREGGEHGVSPEVFRLGWVFTLCWCRKTSLREVAKGRKTAKKAKISERQQLEQHQADKDTNPDQLHILMLIILFLQLPGFGSDEPLLPTNSLQQRKSMHPFVNKRRFFLIYRLLLQEIHFYANRTNW